MNRSRRYRPPPDPESRATRVMHLAAPRRSLVINLCLALPLRPPRLHHRRQFLPHGRTHGLTGCGFLRDTLSFLGSSTVLLCPPGFLSSTDSGTCRRTHTTAFLAARLFRLAQLGWAATWGLGAQSLAGGSQRSISSSFRREFWSGKLAARFRRRSTRSMCRYLPLRAAWVIPHQHQYLLPAQ